ncbi:MAG: branched-chain amino acid ABC transporter permease LivH, partial [Gammaproteobacteria bacterium]|nr:branched-chain amino acid ABC transporter permease LivH [Gammaproteobacteria bacterium]
MGYFLQQLINGFTLGTIYGLIAIGYTMVYGIIGMINFAHGEIYMIGAFVSILCFTLLGIAGITAVPIALVVVLVTAMFFTAAYGWTLERIAYRPLRRAQRLAPLISAIGMSIFLQNYVQLLQGARVKTLQPIIHGGFMLYEDAGFVVQVSHIQVFIWILTILLMVIFAAIIGRTRLGRAQRACAE